jgi:predicted extracellular nuclease
MKKIYTLVLLVFAALASSAQCTELFFSEYAEGSSNNKYLEIYNPSNSAIDLADYSIFQTYGTGSTQFNTFDLTGTLQPYDVFIIATDAASTDITSEADTLLSFPSVVHFNGDDAIALLKGTDTIDAIGILFQRTVWNVGTGNTRNHTLVRKSSVDAPDTAWSTTAVGGWDVLQEDDWTNIGSHTSSCDKSNEPTTAAPNPTKDQEDVISLFSNVYNDVTVDTY